VSKRGGAGQARGQDSNLRDVAANPPRGWPLERRRAYFDWAKAVVDQLPPVSKRLRAAFDEAYSKRP
jgi:guanosine-3',5'-bis(diphosphate) 3'-pyrophosphohydrolase